MYTIPTSCSLDHVSLRERTMDLQSYVSLREGKPNTWSYSPIHPQPFGFLSLCGPQIWHPRRSCEACRNYSRSVNVCVTSARRFLEPKIVVRGCPFVLQFLGDPQSMAVLCDIVLLGISMRIVISQRILYAGRPAPWNGAWNAQSDVLGAFPKRKRGQPLATFPTNFSPLSSFSNHCQTQTWII